MAIFMRKLKVVVSSVKYENKTTSLELENLQKSEITSNLWNYEFLVETLIANIN